MVRCNLSILLAERNLKITKVCNDTGISRTTLTNLANNYSKGIQYDTLNTLCTYLNITPSELISYITTDIVISSFQRKGGYFKVGLKVIFNNKTVNTHILGTLQACYPYSDDPEYYKIHDPNKPCGLDIFIDGFDTEKDSKLTEENELTAEAFRSLPISFLKDIERDIEGKIALSLDQEYNIQAISETITLSLSWNPIFIRKMPPTTE